MNKSIILISKNDGVEFRIELSKETNKAWIGWPDHYSFKFKTEERTMYYSKDIYKC